MFWLTYLLTILFYQRQIVCEKIKKRSGRQSLSNGLITNKFEFFVVVFCWLTHETQRQYNWNWNFPTKFYEVNEIDFFFQIQYFDLNSMWRISYVLITGFTHSFVLLPGFRFTIPTASVILYESVLEIREILTMLNLHRH